MSTQQQSRKALFLDRDGTLIEHIPYLHDPELVKLMPRARESLLAAQEAGFHLFLLTNQSGVGRGYYSLADAEACNARMLELLQLPAPGFTELKICPEHPEGEIVYRKPSPKYLLESIDKYQLNPRACVMIGDSEVDLHAGLNAGIHSILLKNGVAAGKAGVFEHAVRKGACCAEDLASAVRQVLEMQLG